MASPNLPFWRKATAIRYAAHTINSRPSMTRPIAHLLATWGTGLESSILKTVLSPYSNGLPSPAGSFITTACVGNIRGSQPDTRYRLLILYRLSNGSTPSKNLPCPSFHFFIRKTPRGHRSRRMEKSSCTVCTSGKKSFLLQSSTSTLSMRKKEWVAPVKSIESCRSKKAASLSMEATCPFSPEMI